jgi:hypothetical protein
VTPSEAIRKIKKFAVQELPSNSLMPQTCRRGSAVYLSLALINSAVPTRERRGELHVAS